MKPINNIIIVSNQILYIDALKVLVSSMNHTYKVYGSLPDVASIKNYIEIDDETLILMDANGMGKKIWELLSQLRKLETNLKVILLANSNDQIYTDNADKFGAMGFVLKSSPKELLVAAIKIVESGGKFYDPGSKGLKRNDTNLFEKNYKISDREKEVIHLIKKGYSSKSIAEHLNLSFHTVESHRKNIYKKLKINKMTDLIRLLAEFDEN
jgi:DNA-binding NarL/FixJ family response regulator